MPRMRGRFISFCCANSKEVVVRNKSSSFFMSNCALHLLAKKACRLVNRFHQCQAAPPFHTVAKWSAIGLNCADEIFNCVAMSADVAHHRRRRAWILIACVGADQRFVVLAEICSDDTILLEDDGS